jgi:hypothetical protein
VRVRRYALTVLLVAVFPTSVVAQEHAGLAELRELVLHAEYARAHMVAETLLADDDLSASDRLAGLELLATVQIAERDEAAALATFGELLRRDPGYRPHDPDVSPVMRDAYLRAHAQAGDPVVVEVHHEPPVAGTALAIRLGEGADAVDQVRVRYRDVGTSEWATLSVRRSGRGATLRLPDAGSAVEYTIAVLAPSGAVLAELSGPFRVAAAADLAREPAAEPFSVTHADDEGSGAIVGQWWFWTAVGAGVAAAVAVTLIVALSGGDPVQGSLGRGVLE